MLRLQRERDQKFGAGQSIDILLGKNTDKVAQYGHDALTVFGIGTELREAEWRGVVRQLLAQGLLAVEGDYGTLVLTDGSAEVLGRQRQVMMRREPERAAPGPAEARKRRRRRRRPSCRPRPRRCSSGCAPGGRRRRRSRACRRT